MIPSLPQSLGLSEAINRVNSKVALITGITGQDGYYLSDLLLGKGYVVHGIVRPSLSNSSRIACLIEGEHGRNGSFVLHQGDMTNSTRVAQIMQAVRPDEVYNLAAQSHGPDILRKSRIHGELERARPNQTARGDTDARIDWEDQVLSGIVV